MDENIVDPVIEEKKEKIKKRLMEEFEKDSIVISGVGPSLSII